MIREKQKRFGEEYVIDLNATKAAERAGYSKDTAKLIGHENLAKPNIQKYITALQLKISERNDNLAQKEIDELVKVGFSNVQDYIEAGNIVKDLSEIEPHKAAAVSSIKRSVTEFGDAETGGVKTVLEFKLWDKISALEKLGRHLGIFEKDNAQSKPEIGQPFTDSQVEKIILSLRQVK